MTMCPQCEMVYDESEEPYCPYCRDGAPKEEYNYITVEFNDEDD